MSEWKKGGSWCYYQCSRQLSPRMATLQIVLGCFKKTSKLELVWKFNFDQTYFIILFILTNVVDNTVLRIHDSADSFKGREPLLLFLIIPVCPIIRRAGLRCLKHKVLILQWLHRTYLVGGAYFKCITKK